MSGKNALGLRGFPTPSNQVSDDGYLLIYLPNENDWAGLVLGALEALTKPYNFYESGNLTPEQAAERWKSIVTQTPLNKLPTCSFPNGQPMIRLHPDTGRIQTVDENGNWQDDPTLPPTPERPAAPPDDQRCLAAANAANALKIIYEELSDAFNAGLSAAEAANAIAIAIAATIAAAFFPPALALLTAYGLIFQVVFEVVEFATADLWTSHFDDTIKCVLYECASVEDNVVTFDYQCVINRLSQETTIYTPEFGFAEVQLFGQISYLLSFIGADGLNYAGSATAIEFADCGDCDPLWCYEVDLTITPWDFLAVNDGGWTNPFGAWVSGQGWVSSQEYRASTDAYASGVHIVWIFPSFPDVTYSRFEFEYEWQAGDGVQQGVFVYVSPDETHVTPPSDGTFVTGVEGSWINDAIEFAAYPAYNVGVPPSGFNYGNVAVTKVRISGAGENPFGEDNCPSE